MIRTTPVRVLGAADLDSALALAERDPVVNVFVTSRLETAGLSPRELGAEVWGYGDDTGLRALCYAGANLVTVEADADACRHFADRARRQGRHCSSIVGPAAAVEVLWNELVDAWGPAREVRIPQPLLAVDGESVAGTPDPAVRLVRPDEVDTLMPACLAMFTEEVGVSPVAGDGGALYRARVNELVCSGRAFARIEDGRVLFKAEIGAATSRACQVQGVWVDPELRGQGLASSGMAAVARAALRDIAPVVSLYVNDYNEPALRAYRAAGFGQVGELGSVLF